MIVDCESPSKVGYVFETVSDLATGSTVGVQSCDTGYEGPLSDNEITCLDNGVWSDVTGCNLVGKYSSFYFIAYTYM